LGRIHDPLCNAVPVVASFLAEQSKSKAYSTVNIYRSTLSSVLERIDGLPIGQHPEIVLLMKGIFNRRPPSAKYNSTWDVDVFLSYLRNQENTSLPLKDLAAKLATLLALATLFRSSDLAAISRKSNRGAAASKAVAVGASLDSVLSAGHWA
jgi:hypothetical protein